MSVQISTHVDESIKEAFDKVCENIGLSSSGAIKLFIKGVINFNGIPFTVIAAPPQKPKMSRDEMFGCMRGQFAMSDDFDDELADFEEYMA